MTPAWRRSSGSHLHCIASTWVTCLHGWEREWVENSWLLNQQMGPYMGSLRKKGELLRGSASSLPGGTIVLEASSIKPAFAFLSIMRESGEFMPVDWNVIKVGLASQKVSISCWHTKWIRGKLAFQCFFGRGPSNWHRTELDSKHRARTFTLSSFFKDAFSSLSSKPLNVRVWLTPSGDPLLIF